MASGMPHDRSRQQIIRKHMKAQEEDAGGIDRLPREKLVVKGLSQMSPVYRFELKDLVFNKANGRIAAEVKEKEAELGRSLILGVVDDEAIIRSILLSIRIYENNKIQDDLRVNGQMRPGIITADGVVINGNRRKALLEQLFKETGDGKYAYLDAQVLPTDISKSELWLIEAGIQLSAPQQLDYSPINHLLKLREGIDSGLDIPLMAKRIYGVTEDQIRSDLDRLKLIDEYLTDFIRKEGRYYLVNGLIEHFINLQNILLWVERPRGNPKRNWQWSVDDKNELKLVAFYYIRLKFPHLRIRDLREIFATQEAWEELKQTLKVPIELSKKTNDSKNLEPASEADEDEILNEDSSDRDSNFSTTTEQNDLLEEVKWRDQNKPTLKAHFQDAKEQREIVKDSQKPLTLARRAVKILNAIPNDPTKIGDSEIDQELSHAIHRINELRKTIKKAEAGLDSEL